MYKLEDSYSVMEKLRVMAGQIFAAFELSMWCFSKSGDLFYSTSPNEQEILELLKINGCWEYLIANKEGWDRPVILSDSLGMVLIGESVYLDGSLSVHVVVGPFFLNSSSMKEIEKELKNKISSIKAQREFIRILSKIPTLHISALDLYSTMLHFTITDDRVHNSDFYYQFPVERIGQTQQKLTEDDWNDEAPDMHAEDRAVDIEQKILQAIRDGDANIKYIMSDAAGTTSGYTSETGNSIRDAKNTLLVLNALSSRAASEGGIPLKTARAIQQEYMSEIEKCSTITQLHKLCMKMIDEYISKVRASKEEENVSRSIRECCDYIRANIQKDLTVEDIARNMGYTTYYFTKKFSKETGIKVTDYIKQAKIDYAKIVLVSSQKSIQEISDSLHFGTRNYFSKVFREIVGMTPAAYRERMG